MQNNIAPNLDGASTMLDNSQRQNSILPAKPKKVRRTSLNIPEPSNDFKHQIASYQQQIQALQTQL